MGQKMAKPDPNRQSIEHNVNALETYLDSQIKITQARILSLKDSENKSEIELANGDLERLMDLSKELRLTIDPNPTNLKSLLIKAEMIAHYSEGRIAPPPSFKNPADFVETVTQKNPLVPDEPFIFKPSPVNEQENASFKLSEIPLLSHLINFIVKILEAFKENTAQASIEKTKEFRGQMSELTSPKAEKEQQHDNTLGNSM